MTESEPLATQTSFEVPGLRLAAEPVRVQVAVVDQTKQARRDILNVESSLEVTQGLVVEGTHVIVSDFVVADCRSQLDPVEFAGIACCDIPHVVFTSRGRDRETTEGRAVIANDIARNAVAVTPGTAHTTASEC